MTLPPAVPPPIVALGLTLALGLGMTPRQPKRWLPDLTEHEADLIVTVSRSPCEILTHRNSPSGACTPSS